MRLRISAGIAATLIALAVLGTAFLLTLPRWHLSAKPPDWRDDQAG